MEIKHTDNTDATFSVKFIEEAMLMKNFDHLNVLSLLGLTFDPQGSPLVVLPFMHNGDLRSFLRKDDIVSEAFSVFCFLFLLLPVDISYFSKFTRVHHQ